MIKTFLLGWLHLNLTPITIQYVEAIHWQATVSSGSFDIRPHQHCPFIYIVQPLSYWLAFLVIFPLNFTNSNHSTFSFFLIISSRMIVPRKFQRKQLFETDTMVQNMAKVSKTLKANVVGNNRDLWASWYMMVQQSGTDCGGYEETGCNGSDTLKRQETEII